MKAFSACVDLTYVVTVHNAKTASSAQNKINKWADKKLEKLPVIEGIECEIQNQVLGVAEQIDHNTAFEKISRETSNEYFVGRFLGLDKPEIANSICYLLDQVVPDDETVPAKPFDKAKMAAAKADLKNLIHNLEGLDLAVARFEERALDTVSQTPREDDHA